MLLPWAKQRDAQRKGSEEFQIFCKVIYRPLSYRETRVSYYRSFRSARVRRWTRRRWRCRCPWPRQLLAWKGRACASPGLSSRCHQAPRHPAAVHLHLVPQRKEPPGSLALAHVVVTWPGPCLRWQLDGFTPESRPACMPFPRALSFCGFVVFPSLSPQDGTTSTYRPVEARVAVASGYHSHPEKNFSTRIQVTTAACHLRCKPAFLLGCEAECAGNGVCAPGVSVTSVYPVWAGSA